MNAWAHIVTHTRDYPTYGWTWGSAGRLLFRERFDWAQEQHITSLITSHTNSEPTPGAPLHFPFRVFHVLKRFCHPRADYPRERLREAKERWRLEWGWLEGDCRVTKMRVQSESSITPQAVLLYKEPPFFRREAVSATHGLVTGSQRLVSHQRLSWWDQLSWWLLLVPPSPNKPHFPPNLHK